MNLRKRIGSPGEEAVLLHLSQYEPASHLDHAEMFGIQPTAAFNRMRRLWDRKQIYIHSWRRSVKGGPMVPMYAIGCLADAPKIAKLTATEACRKYRAKASKEKLYAIGRRSTEIRMQKLKNDPEYRQKIKEYRREWGRKTYGYVPRSLTDREQLNEIAMQFGITWRKAA